MNKPLLLFLIVFLLSIYPITDTDFGWHLKVGQFILENHQVPKTDLFSFSLPNFQYVYYSWAGEALIYFFYNIAGLYAVTLFYALVLTLSVFIIYKTCQLTVSKQPFLPLFIILTPFIHVVAGGRMRAFGFLFLTLFYYLLVKFLKTGSKYIFFLPLVFLLWVNFHGSFLIGLGILAIAIIYTLILEKQFNNRSKLLIIVFLISILAILISPYSYRILLQTLTITTNEVGTLEHINQDWYSPFRSKIGASIYLGVLIPLCLFALKSKLDIYQKILLFVFLALSAKTQRFLFAFVLVLSPFLAYFLEHLIRKIKKMLINSRILLLYNFIFATLLSLFILVNLLEITIAYSSFKNYSTYVTSLPRLKEAYQYWSPEGFDFLERKYSDKNILTDANWEGLRLFHEGNKKVFYYGAMDNFTDNGRLFPFIYLSLINAQGDWQQILNKYKVEVIYLPKAYPLISALKKDSDWELTYEDSKTSIFLKK